MEEIQLVNGQTRSYRRDRVKVRAELMEACCGFAGHMTVDQMRERSIGDEACFACPECGQTHLTTDDIINAALRLIRKSDRFKRISRQAEEEPY